MKIGTRVLAYGLFLAWIPLILIGAFVTYTIGPMLEASVAAKASATARANADAVNELLQGVNSHLQAVATTSHERLFTMTGRTRQALFYDLLKVNPLLEEIYLLDKDGRALEWVSRWRVTIADEPEKAVVNANVRGSFITNVQREADGRLVSMICVPIRSLGWQQTIGYLGGKVRLRGVADLALARSGLTGGAIFIVDQDGRLVGHEDFSQVLSGIDVKTSGAVQAFMRDMNTSRSGTADVPSVRQDDWMQRYVNYRGVDVLGSYFPVGNWGWAVIVEEERNEALRPVSDWIWRFNLVGIFLTLAVIMMSYVISRKITEPIRALEAGANKVARGEWDQDLPGSGTDEIGQLVAAFNHMLREQRGKKN